MKIPVTISIILVSALLILSAGCAPLRRSVQEGQMTRSRAEMVISSITCAGGEVRSFYSLGVVTVKGWVLDSDADILIAGIKDPFAMKIEVTHSWGRPVLHILVRDGRISVVSFQEKLIYTGRFTPDSLSRFLPGLDMDSETLWSALSGRPPIVSHEGFDVSGPDRIGLEDRDGTELEAVYISPEDTFPGKVSFPGQALVISFSDIREDGGIPYAGEIRLEGEDLERDLALTYKKLVFNASVPEEIFELETPTNYDTVDLDR